MNLSTMKQPLGRLVIVRLVKGRPTQTEQLSNTIKMEECVLKNTSKPTSACWQGFACLCVSGGGKRGRLAYSVAMVGNLTKIKG